MTTEIPQLPSLIHTSTVVVSVIFPALSLLSIYIRWSARRMGKQTFHSDDWWIVISWLSSLGLSILLWVTAARTGIDQMKGDPMKGISNSLLCLWLASALVQLPLGAVKISILLFYKRIFSIGNEKFAVAVWITIALIGAWTWLFFLLVIFQLDPVSGAWTGVGRLRFDSAALGLGQVGTSIGLDLLVLCFPLPVIHKLQLSTKKKWAVGTIFWLGAFCVVAAIVRLVLLNESIHTVVDATGFNTVFVQWKNFIFMILEPNCSIIAACLPTYGPLFKGAWNMESLMRSFRSVFSLQSRGSGAASRPTNDYSKFSDKSTPQSDANSTNSQFELNNGHKGRGFVEIERMSHGSRDEEDVNGINVTRGVQVIRHDV
ncbi:hypothetical protein EJ04DRAFT_450090 [Polyplosphaeria fusca]|uniref:Rhodopsin domain-containing protein n=1 Tax=Polyplosphaeria fusca TaxID=682080 RepID=A0A9P4QLV9_9PLEO|nr:hypothetical protein EJ04DRAFT_450090 [Polyplosphaeria fusca]